MKIWRLIPAVLLLAGCEEHKFAPPDRAARVSAADSAFTEARFDTIKWSSDEERLRTGNLVYVEHCRRCHGPVGEGNTAYAQDQNLDVPSLVTPDWPLASQPDSVRRRVYVGHVRGMPTYGIAGITVREIDAVTSYVLELLR
jgi:mono/diheme cytochrome c family protein